MVIKETFHPVIAEYIDTDASIRSILASFSTGAVAEATVLLHDFINGTQSANGAFLAARQADTKGEDTDLCILFLGSWADASIRQTSETDETDSAAWPLIHRARALISEKTPPEVSSYIDIVEGRLLGAYGNLTKQEKIIRSALSRISGQSQRRKYLVIELGSLLASLGRLNEFSDEFNALESLLTDNFKEIEITIIRFIDHVETGRILEAQRLVPIIAAADTGINVTRNFKIYRTILELMSNDTKSTAFDSSGNSGVDLPDWALVIQCLISGSIHQALRWARICEKNGSSSTKHCDCISFNLLRAELADGNGEAARRLIALRHESGNRHFLDHFFLSRVELLCGKREEAIDNFKIALTAADNHDAAGRINFELRLAAEIPRDMLLQTARSLVKPLPRTKKSDELRETPNTTDLGETPNTTELGGTPNTTDLGETPNATELGGTPNATELGGTPNATELGETPNTTDLGETPNATELGGTHNATEQIQPQKIISGVTGADRFIGSSKASYSIREMITKLADLTVPILITGETGTGKEVAARAIHDAGQKRDLPFVAVNCGAISESLLESELFGHEKGAFSGAATAHSGLFAEAGKGIVLLDEIGEISPRLQVALLRVLETGEIRPVGSSKSHSVNCRILASTNADLQIMTNNGTFRRDLLFRLKRLELYLPPLRERPEDILLLAHHFLDLGRPAGVHAMMSENLIQQLLKYSWPGNVRELRHSIERMRLMNSDKLHYDAKDLNVDSQDDTSISLPNTEMPKSSSEFAGFTGHSRIIIQKKTRTKIRRLAILRELFAEHNLLTRNEISKALEISPNTATSDLKILCREGIIERIQPSASPRSVYFVQKGKGVY